MPIKVNVKVNSVGTMVRGEKNMIVLKGYDHTNNKGFDKSFFEEKKSGGLTQAAQAAETLQENDWVEVTMDDSSWKNVTMIKKISAPAGGDVNPNQNNPAGQTQAATSRAKSEKMSKEEWAAKQLKEATYVARAQALTAAVAVHGEGLTKKNVHGIEKLTKEFCNYLLNGDFHYVKPEPVVAKPEPVAQMDNTPEPSPTPEDDDIPF